MDNAGENLQKLNQNVERLITVLDEIQIDMKAQQKKTGGPLKKLGFNFLSAMVHGLGVAIGMTLVTALFLFISFKIFSSMVNLPMIGGQMNDLNKLMNQYMPKGQSIRINQYLPKGQHNR